MSHKFLDYPVTGDKKNSDFFEEYKLKIYNRRIKSGLQDLLNKMVGVVVQVEPGEGVNYICELSLMTPYRLEKAYQSHTHNIYALKNSYENAPMYFILEPADADHYDEINALNHPYGRARLKTCVKYLGEIYDTKDLAKTRDILSEQDVRFLKPANVKNDFLLNENFAFTQFSYYTGNAVGYIEKSIYDHADFGFGKPFTVSEETKKRLDEADKAQVSLGLTGLVTGLDHLATRILCGDREHAILEYLTMTPYYFWGAYNIFEQNSSTNVTRNCNHTDEVTSPAKVFTANNTPFYVNSMIGLPCPTENFVRNFGRRMHHLAYAVLDGEQSDGRKNIDFVVQNLEQNGIPFLSKIFGECKDFPDLKQIFSKSSPFSFLVTEYVQRCHNFQGFFTRANVADLTASAGKDEQLSD